ncbi:hypothetical protein B0H17DRAFT_1144549 [Mycena rosella]|uniref:Uncharacterized protein n=1 Tax=Mycena rosella TaxID=1033263 RepID=A0AAD7G5J6_MYCRO|nr:hypothetical protein B0H17DRAFT_1144549 [Mycena rosella]
MPPITPAASQIPGISNSQTDSKTEPYVFKLLVQAASAIREGQTRRWPGPASKTRRISDFRASRAKTVAAGTWFPITRSRRSPIAFDGIYNTLMTEVLSYSTYAVHGTDWGCVVAYSLYNFFNTTVYAAQFVFIPFFSVSPQELADNNITLSAIQNVTEQRYTNGRVQPNDIGLALYDSPVGQLAWMGGKYKLWSDPRAGTPPSVLKNTVALTSLSLFYLIDSFLSSVWVNAQNPNGFRTVYTKANTDAPMLFSQYKYNPLFGPKMRDFGGHFPELENSPAVIEDTREMGPYFTA